MLVLRQNRNRDYVAFFSAACEIEEVCFDAAHYVADDFAVFFGDDEGFWKTIMQVDEEVWRIVFGEAYLVYAHDFVEVVGLELSYVECCLHGFLGPAFEEG